MICEITPKIKLHISRLYERLLTISSLEHSRLIDSSRQLHLGAFYVGIYEWAQRDLKDDKRTNSTAVSEVGLLSVYSL